MGTTDGEEFEPEDIGPEGNTGRFRGSKEAEQCSGRSLSLADKWCVAEDFR